MRSLTLSDITVGDILVAYVYTGTWKGADHNDPVCFKTVRVNRKTVTVRPFSGGREQRVEPHHFTGKIKREDAW